MSGGDGQAEVGGHEHCERGAELNAEAGRRRDERQVLAERLHHAAAPHPQADGDADAAVQ